jgi:hypothetical protein
MNREDNARHNIEQAVRALSVGKGDVKHRVQDAFIHHLGYVSPDDVPSHLSEMLTSIRSRLTREPSYKGQSTVESALYRMHKSTAAKIATDIWELYRALTQWR